MHGCAGKSGKESGACSAMNFEALIWREPWLAPVILNLKRVVENQDIQEAAITPDGRTLYYNPEFWRHLSPEERLGVQLHEILHIVSLHAKRRENREYSKWNMAYEKACRADFDCIVVLTDGYLAFPESEPRQTIWAMPESFGRRMEVIL